MTPQTDTLKSSFLKEALARGFIHQCTDWGNLDTLLSIPDTAFYVGFDATAKSLHVGNLVQIMIARLGQKHGLRPIILMGGGTTKIGDPSGKTEMRQVLTEDSIQENISSIQTIFERFLMFGKASGMAKMVNNADWLEKLNYIEFLRDYGRHFSVNRMISFDSVKLRLEREQPLSFLEFNYMIFQAYDFLELFRKEKCVLQLGGSDQWGNIVSGVDLVRRCENASVYGLTSQLITTSSGAKMGKTAQGAVWLRADLKSPYEYWQFWRNTEDGDVEKFLKLFTDMSVEEIEELCKSPAHINDAKKKLADLATTLVHGEKAAEDARSTAVKLFESGEKVSDIKVLGRDEQGKLSVVSTLPVIELDREFFKTPKTILDCLIIIGFCQSKGEGKRLIQGNGIKLNDEMVEDEGLLITPEHFAANGLLKLSAGKKRHGLIYIS